MLQFLLVWLIWNHSFKSPDSFLLPSTKFTLTAVLTAQFTSPHHLTLAGEGKIHSPHWQVGHKVQQGRLENWKLSNTVMMIWEPFFECVYCFTDSSSLMYTGQIQTQLYIRVPWIRSPRKCLLGGHRSCSPNEVITGPLWKASKPFLVVFYFIHSSDRCLLKM